MTAVLLQSATSVITKCDRYYKVRQVLQSATVLLQSATGITKCDDYYKVRQNIVVWRLLHYCNSPVKPVSWTNHALQEGRTDKSGRAQSKDQFKCIGVGHL